MALIDYSELEANQLLALIDFAVKAQGLTIAKVASEHEMKLKQAFLLSTMGAPVAQAEPVKPTKKKGRPKKSGKVIDFSNVDFENLDNSKAEATQEAIQ